jgi:hypothetical protein
LTHIIFFSFTVHWTLYNKLVNYNQLYRQMYFLFFSFWPNTYIMIYSVHIFLISVFFHHFLFSYWKFNALSLKEWNEEKKYILPWQEFNPHLLLMTTQVCHILHDRDLRWPVVYIELVNFDPKKWPSYRYYSNLCDSPKPESLF